MSFMYLDEESLSKVRAAVNQHRRPGTYEPGKWSVSHFNREPQVVGKLPGAVRLRDITLRTIEQTPGVCLTDAERVKLAEALAEANISDIEVGMFGDGFSISDDTLKKLVKAIKAINPNCELSMGLSRTRDIDRCVEAGVDKVSFFHPSILGLIPAFYYLHVWEGKDWRAIRAPQSIEEDLERWYRLITLAKEKGVKVGVGLNLVGYATEEFIRHIVTHVVPAGADEVGIYDSTHGMGPEAWKYLSSFVRNLAPNCEISMHTHNDFGVAVANCLAAALGGADVLEVSVNGVGGPGAGQADLAETAAGLEAFYGISTGIRLEHLTPLSRLVGDITREAIPNRKAIVGENAFYYGDYDEMIFMGGVDPLLYCPIEPQIFGNRMKSVGQLHCVSGNWSAWLKLKELGLEVDKSQVPLFMDKVKEEMRLRKRQLLDSELKQIVATMGQSSGPSRG